MNKSLIKNALIFIILGTATFVVAANYGLAIKTTVTEDAAIKSSVVSPPKTEIILTVYSDSSCTTPLDSIDWGILGKGEVVNHVVFLKNTGNATGIAQCKFSNFSPKNAESYIDLSWDSEGATLNPGEVHEATIILKVIQNFEGLTDFKVDIDIYALPYNQ